MSSKLDKNSTAKKDIKYSFSNVTMLISNILMIIANIYCYIAFLRTNLGHWTVWVIVGSILLLILGVVSFFKNKSGWLKADLVIIVLVTLFSWGYCLFVIFDLLKYLSNPDDLRELIASTGFWAYIIYVLIQFLQVTFIPVPAIVTTLVGTVLFGPGIATILSLIGILLGSLVAFVIGDKLGERVVAWIVGEKNVKKYGNLLYDKGKYMFFLMLLFPVFPDDVLCLIAGMTAMSYRFFLITILITRPIGIVMTCYLGSGTIIPYDEPWGIAVWAILIILMIIAFWISYRYKNKIENIVNICGIKLKNWVQKTGTAIKIGAENFLALFSKNYRTKLLIKRNRYPYLLLPESTSQNTEEVKVPLKIKPKSKSKKKSQVM